MQPRLAQRGVVFLQRSIQRVIAAPILGEKDVVDQAGGLDQLHQRAAVAHGETADVHVQLGRSEAGSHLLQLRKIRRVG